MMVDLSYSEIIILEDPLPYYMLLLADPVRPPLRGHGPHGELRLHAAAQELQGAVPRLRGRQARLM